MHPVEMEQCVAGQARPRSQPSHSPRRGRERSASPSLLSGVFKRHPCCRCLLCSLSGAAQSQAGPGRKFRLAYTNSYVSYNRWITDSIARHRCGQGPPRSPWPCFSPHFARVLAGLPCTSLACAASLRCQVPCVFPLMHVAHRVIPRRLARCCSEHACCTEVLLPPLRHRRRTIPPRCRHTRCSSTILPIDPMT